MPFGPQRGADVPGMPGYYYVLNYNSAGQYTGTSIAGSPASTPTTTTPGGTATGVTSGVTNVDNGGHLTYTVGDDVDILFHGVPSSAGPQSSTLVPPGLSWSGNGVNGSFLRGQVTTAGVYVVTAGSGWNSQNFSETVTITVNAAPVDTPPVPIGGGSGVLAVGTVGTGTKGWLAARADARAGHTICRSNWKDRYIYFSNYLYWIQFYDATSKLLGAVRVVQVADFGISEFQAQDWTIFGDLVTPSTPPWNYPLATNI